MMLKKTIRRCVENASLSKNPTVILHQYDPISEPEDFVKEINDSGIEKYSVGNDGIIFTLANSLSKGKLLQDSLKSKKNLNFSIFLIKNIKPFNNNEFLNLIKNVHNIVCIEEHTLPGGLGSILAEVLSDNKIEKNLIRIGIDDKFINAGNNIECSKEAGLDQDSITEKVTSQLKN